MNRYNPKIHHRKSIRLKGYDYSRAGLYYITICVQNRKHLFGRVENKKMIFSEAGEMIENQWLALTQRFPKIQLHEYIIMPNHFHSILEIIGTKTTEGASLILAPDNEKGQPQGIAPTNKTIGDIIGAFKSITTNEYIKNVKANNWQRFDRRLWQRNYWERIIRDEKAYDNISDYIIDNPKNWNEDKFYN